VKRKALGRGLAALIPDANKGSADYFLCPIERIHLPKNQPRHHFDDDRLMELSDSIKQQGVLQPLVVRPGSGDQFILVAGERRWRAAQKAGIHDVPVVIRSITEREAFEVALVENIQREDLNALEEAEAYRQLLEDHGYTQEQLAARVGRDRSTVANSLRLLKLPPQAQQALVNGRLSPGHARALLALEKAGQINSALKQIVDKQLSVRQVETLVKRLRQGPPAKTAPVSSPNIKDLEVRLSRVLKSRVHLVTTPKGSGQIEIAYSSLDELDRLLEVLLK
jgi:ParB family transcriptional regulator, chromosome partitioning protein